MSGDQLQTCPGCHGRGGHPIPFTGGVLAECDVCEGAKHITLERLQRWQHGRKLRELRLRRGYGLTDAAQMMGISAGDLSRIERGVMDPDPKLALHQPIDD